MSQQILEKKNADKNEKEDIIQNVKIIDESMHSCKWIHFIAQKKVI